MAKFSSAPLFLLALLPLLVENCWAFVGVSPSQSSTRKNRNTQCLTATQLNAVVNLESIDDICYTTSVSKPMGVIFGENPPPVLGLVVDDMELGSAGGAAGIRVGDQLVAISGQAVVGLDFDRVMDALRTAPDPMMLQLYRGTAKSLFTIVANRDAFSSEDDNEDDNDVEEDVVVMDENYESPVRINVNELEQEDEPLSVGDVFNAFKKMGQALQGPEPPQTSTPSSPSSSSLEGKKSGGGLFGGMFGESIQLEGNDAKTDGQNL